MNYHDKAELWESEFFRRRCLDLAECIKPELVDEHRANPLAFRQHHSLLLQRIDRLLKTCPAEGRRLLPVLGSDARWRVMVLRREEPVQLMNDPVFNTLEDVVHYIFKIRLESLNAVVRGACNA